MSNHLSKQAAFLCWLFIFIAGLATVTSYGDVVETQDGASLVGRITSIADGKIHLETSYAGTLAIDQKTVVNFTTDQPVYLRLASGTTMAGQVEKDEQGRMMIENEDGLLITTPEKVSTSWAPGEKDPLVVKQEEEIEKTRRKWKYQAAVDLTGKSGNTDESGTAIRLDATLESPQDSLKFYFLWDKAETNGAATANEIIGGVNYNSFFKKKIGWFVRAELESDDFEALDLRTTAAGGLTYRIINQETHKFRVRGGLSYRYESYSNGTNVEAPGLDLGAYHEYQFGKWGKITTNLGFLPSFEDFSDYRFSQDTGFDVPLGLSDFWKLRLGIANSYNSNPSPGREKLDTTYYSRLILSWE